MADNGTKWALPKTTKIKDGRSCVYGVRPENLVIAKKGNKAEIRVVEPSGSETQVVTEVSGEKIVCLFRERISNKPGDTITILPDADKSHLFDADSGLRIS